MQHHINISIDDVSPHKNSSIAVVGNCYKIIERFPDAKFSLFVPVSYWRTVKPAVATNYPLQIDLYPEFCKQIMSLPESNFEICYHGLYHGIPGMSDNDEFKNLSYGEALDRFSTMQEIVKRAGLDSRFKNIFRPPAWRMSAESILAAKDFGIEILALSPKDYARKTYEKHDEMFPRVLYYNCNPPFEDLKLFEKTEIVYHACDWDKNHLNDEKTEELLSWLDNVKKRNVKFSFIDGMV